MRRWLSIAMLVLTVALLTACGSNKAVPTDYKTDVAVEGTKATLVVEVPGKKIGTDYHPHLRLNDGPEVMMYSPSYSFNNLKPGKYTIKVQLAQPGHDPIPGTAKAVDFEVK